MSQILPLTGFALRLQALIKASEQWEDAFADCSFGSLALELFQLQLQRNIVYRRFVGGRSLDPIQHWSQIPAAPALGFKEFELSCLLPEERKQVFRSSGTTQQRPSCHYHSVESLSLYEDSAWAWFQSNVLRGIGSVDVGSIVILTPSPTQAPHSSLVHMFEVVRQRIPRATMAYTARIMDGGLWELDWESTCEALKVAASAGSPALVLGTAFSFVHLLDHLAEHKLRIELPIGSRVMETGGYKGRSRSIAKAELHKLICRQLGIRPNCLIVEYGMSELSSQAYDRDPPNAGRSSAICNNSRQLRFPPWARAQVISPETGLEAGVGEMGLIRVFDLANTFSVLAVQTEDLGIRHKDGFQLIGRAAMSESRGCSLMPAA